MAGRLSARDHVGGRLNVLPAASVAITAQIGELGIAALPIGGNTGINDNSHADSLCELPRARFLRLDFVCNLRPILGGDLWASPAEPIRRAHQIACEDRSLRLPDTPAGLLSLGSASSRLFHDTGKRATSR